MDDETREEVAAHSVAYYDSTLYDMMGLDYDDPLWDDLLDQLTVDDMINMVNLGGFQTVAVDSIGKVGTLDSDGTSGLNDWYIGVYGTAYSTELLIAQTWNKDLAYRIGVAEGAEYADLRDRHLRRHVLLQLHRLQVVRRQQQPAEHRPPG